METTRFHVKREQDIEIQAQVEVRVQATCPQCRKALIDRALIPAVVVDACLVDTIKPTLAGLRAKLREVMVARGWTDVCGACRDNAPMPHQESSPRWGA